ncbi:helicase [Prochlorococcus sp. MIT 1223]|uniref:helicase n=1 Tax=Prochlorococcus sp. MIT 1223 TaxID=3096217 RepID=UPI002A74F04E|nr:helicase [Prochlorococcus sp. MIT 1223]
MLEANAHNHLKVLLQSETSIWHHNLTLSRLVARSLRRRDKSLLQLPIGSKNYWWPGILIPLCLDSSDAVLVLSLKQRRRLLDFELPRLKDAGLHFPLWEGLEPPPNGKVWLLDYAGFLYVFENGLLNFKQIIIPEAEFLCERLRETIAIKIHHLDWEQLRRALPVFDSAFLEIYQRITKRIFIQAASEDAQVSIDNGDLLALKDLLTIAGSLPSPWPEIVHAIKSGWASWGQLNHKTLDWTWHLQPLEPLKHIQSLLNKSSFLMLAGSLQNDLLLSELKTIPCELNVSISLGRTIHQEPIQLFVPYRQPLPNTEYFAEYLLDQCRRLILGVPGITIILLDDFQLRAKLTSQLAAEFGRRVVQETTTPESNGVVSCSCSWWLKHHEQIPVPHQLIFAILPFTSLESPLLQARVNELKKEGRDWFRDLLLPDVLNMIPFAVEPIRKNQGRVAILDGRLRSRSWGGLVFRTLEPWTPLERLMPS